MSVGIKIKPKFINKESLMELLTKEGFIKICNELGAEVKKDSRGNLITNTRLCHAGGNSEKLYFYFDPKPEIPGDKGKRVVCYTCGQRYSVIELVLRAMKNKGRVLSYAQALNYIADIIGYSPADANSISTIPSDNDMGWINNLLSVKNKRKIKHPKVLNEHYLEIFSYVPITQWESEGISGNTIQKYQISYSDSNDSIVIPHRYWQDGSLVGIKQRLLNEERIKKSGKYIPVTIQGYNCSYPTSLNLYGLYQNMDFISNIGKIVLLESEKSVLLADTYFPDNNFTVALTGSNLSKTHIEIIKKIPNLREVMFALDREYEDPHSYTAQIYLNKLIMMAKPFMNLMTVYLIVDSKHRIGYKDSPIDRGRDTFLELMREKIEVTTEMVKDVEKTRRKKR